MCPAPRKPQNRGLERNLHWHTTKGFRWWNPAKGKYVYFGKLDPNTDRPFTPARANEWARALNLRLSVKGSIIDKAFGPESTSIRTLVDLHVSEVLSKRTLSEKSRTTYDYYLRRIQREVGSWDVAAVSPYDLAQKLKTICKGDRARQLYRQQFVELFNTAVEEGLRDDNPAMATRRPQAERRRLRLIYEGFVAIYQFAEPWLRNSMDLALLTLQRREDLCALRWEAVQDGFLRVQQRKTGVRLSILIGPDLDELLHRCRDNIPSPFVIHRLPVRAHPMVKRSPLRVHHTQILPEQLTRSFEAARQRSGYYADIGQGSDPPSFHEIRSLGIALYRDAGWPDAKIKALAGHEDIAMTHHYLKGHVAPWEEVSCGLVLPKGSVTETLP